MAEATAGTLCLGVPKTLRHLLHYAVRVKLLDENPASLVPSPVPKRREVLTFNDPGAVDAVAADSTIDDTPARAWRQGPSFAPSCSPITSGGAARDSTEKRSARLSPQQPSASGNPAGRCVEELAAALLGAADRTLLDARSATLAKPTVGA